jgi:hypothetical protein
MLFLDGVYVDNWKAARFRWVKAPTSAELTQKPRVNLTRYQGVFEPTSSLINRPITNVWSWLI